MNHPMEPKITSLTALAARMVERLPKGGRGGTDALMQVHRYIANLAETATALRELHAVRNPTETEGAHVKRVATAAKKFALEIESTRERMAKAVQEGLAGLEAQIRAKTALVPDAYAAEVRAVYRAMSPEERTKLFVELLDEKRGAEFAAIVKAPRSLTGMPDHQRQQFELAYVARHAAAELLDQTALKEALETASVAAGVASEVASAYNDPATLAEIARAEAAAEAAAKKFESTVSA